MGGSPRAIGTIVLFVVLLSPHPTMTKSPVALLPVVLPVIPTVSTPHIGDVLFTESIAILAGGILIHQDQRIVHGYY